MRFVHVLLATSCASALLPVLASSQGPVRGHVQLLEPTPTDCNDRAVLQRFTAQSSLCVVGVATDSAGISGVLLNGTDAVLKPGADGATRFVAYIRTDRAATNVDVVVQTRTGVQLVYAYELKIAGSGATASHYLMRKDPMAPPEIRTAALAESSSPGSPAPFQGAAAPETAASEEAGTIVIIEPREWLGEGKRDLQVAPGDSLRVVGRVSMADGLNRVTVNGKEVALQPHPSGAMAFITFIKAEEVARGIVVEAFPPSGEPLRKAFGVAPALAENAESATSPMPAPGNGVYLEVLEPKEWDGSETRSITWPARRSIRVVGETRHPGGVRAVLIDNGRATLRPRENGVVQFIGYVPVDSVQKSVEIRVEPVNGVPLRQRYSVNPDLTAVREEPARAATFSGERWAVVIGISEYQDSTIRALQYGDRDAQAIYDFLRSERAGAGGFKEDHIRLLINEQATYQSIRSALRTFLKSSTEKDQVVVYFAGHGAPDPQRTQDMYLLAYDTRRDDISATGFPMKDVQDAMQAVVARDILVITDACHSGAIQMDGSTRGGLEANMINDIFLSQLNASSGGMVSFTASMGNQTSTEGERWGGGHGVFTYYMLEALNGAADEDHDGIVTLVEMMEFTKDRVRRETGNAQIPNISTTSYDQLWPLSIATSEGTLAAATRATESITARSGVETVAAADTREVRAAREKVALYPGSAPYRSELAQALEKAGRLNDAIAEYQEAARLEPGNAERKYQLATMLRDTNRPEAARMAFEEAKRLSPDNAAVRNGLGQALKMLGQHDRALDEFRRAVRLDPGFGRYHRDLAAELQGQGSARGAVSEYEEAIRIEPTVASYQFEYAGALQAAGQMDAGIRALGAAAKLDLKNVTYQRAHAEALQSAGRAAEAVDAYKRAVQLDPKDAKVHHALSLLYRGLGMQFETVESLRMAVKLDPGVAAYHYELGEALRTTAKPEGAPAEYEAALHVEPDNARYHHGYGMALSRVGKPKEAMEQLREALRLEAANAMFHHDLAALLHEAGLLNDAVTELAQAVANDSQNPVYKRELNEWKREQKLQARKK